MKLINFASLLLFLYLDPVKCITFEEDTTLSKQQSLALKKLKNRVVSKLEHAYQKEDLFILRFLRAKNFDVTKAEHFLLNEMKWRRDNNWENIHDEDWSDLKDYVHAIRVDGVDKAGRPLIAWELGDWDIRKAAIRGKMERLLLYTFKTWDLAQRKVTEFANQGKNVSRWNMIIDLRNVNAISNVNAASMPFYLGSAIGIDAHFPGMGDKIILVNTPQLFETVLALAKPLLSPVTRESLKVYGKNEVNWKPIINEIIDPSELPKRYRGTKDIHD